METSNLWPISKYSFQNFPYYWVELLYRDILIVSFWKEVEYDSSCFQLKTKLQAFTTQLVTDLNPIYGQCYAICYAQLWYAISARWGNASQREKQVCDSFRWKPSHCLMSWQLLFDILTILWYPNILTILWYPNNCLMS